MTDKNYQMVFFISSLTLTFAAVFNKLKIKSHERQY